MRLFICLILVSCAASQPVTPVSEDLPQITKDDPRWRETYEAAYQFSLQRIYDKWKDEIKILEQDFQNGDYQSFKNHRREFCQSDTSIDLHGMIHTKPYCAD